MIFVLGLSVAAAASAVGQLEIDAALRNGKGFVRICLTRRAEDFPSGCERDPDALKRTVPAAFHVQILIHNLAPGDYAIALLHDENGNGRLDRIGPVPTEGFGFSNNPKLRFGPPSFRQARFTLAAGAVRQTIQMHYLL